MDEHDFEALRAWKPFSSDDMKNAERLPALALALWGRTPEDLRQLLLAATPKVPRGCSLAHLKLLEQQAKQFLTATRKSPSTFGRYAHEVIAIGSQTFSVPEGRCEVVRRAIEHLEGHR
jgi:hypothetical protein